MPIMTSNTLEHSYSETIHGPSSTETLIATIGASDVHSGPELIGGENTWPR